jgi:hypothetical protein
MSTVVIEVVEQGPQGPTGAQGPAFTNYEGAWSSATAYVVNDAVTRNGSSYICILAHTNQAPPNATYWGLIASKGDTGATGATGPQGPAGSVSSLVAADITDSTATGRSVLTSNAAAGRTALGLGTAAVEPTSTFAAASHNHAASEITSGTMDIARLPEATTAQFLANTADKVLSTDQVWAGAAPVTLTDAATIAIDMGTGINFSVTLTASRTLGAPTNAKAGQSGVIVVKQNGTGGWTLSYNAVYKFQGGSAVAIDTTASRTSLLSYFVEDSSNIHISVVPGSR